MEAPLLPHKYGKVPGKDEPGEYHDKKNNLGFICSTSDFFAKFLFKMKRLEASKIFTFSFEYYVEKFISYAYALYGFVRLNLSQTRVANITKTVREIRIVKLKNVSFH